MSLRFLKIAIFVLCVFALLSANSYAQAQQNPGGGGNTSTTSSSTSTSVAAAAPSATLGYRNYTTVYLNLSTGGAMDNIPFDVRFKLVGRVSQAVRSMTLIYGYDDCFDISTLNCVADCGCPKGETGPREVPWARKLTDTLIITPTDTLVSFHFDVPALRPFHNYKFQIKLERYVSLKEGRDLDVLFRQIYPQALYQFYNSGDQTALVLNLQDTTSIPMRRLISRLTDTCVLYYKDRNLVADKDSIYAVIKSKIIPFMNSNFYGSLVDKKNKDININNQIQFAVTNYLDLSSSTPLLVIYNNMRIKPLGSIGIGADKKNFTRWKLSKDDSATLAPLRSLLLDPVNLQNTISLKAYARDSDYTLLANASSFPTRIKILTQGIDSITKIMYLVSFYSTMPSDSFKQYFKDGNQADFVTVVTKLTKLLNSLYVLRSLAMNFMLDERQLEATRGGAQFNFRGEFPVVITAPELTSGDFITRGQWLVNADVGMAVLFLNDGIKYPEYYDVTPYYGVNFNIFPVNLQQHYTLWGLASYKKDTVKAFQPYSVGGMFLRTLSVVFGITVTSVNDPNRADLFPSTVSKSLLTGVGLRLTDAFRISCGFVYTYLKNPNPLISVNRFKADGYLSASLDFNLFQWLGNFGKNVPGY